jgi:hypothetical protein
VDRIVGETVGIIAVGMATGDGEDALREQIADARASGTVAVWAASRPTWRSAACRRIAPPSALAWG